MSPNGLLLIQAVISAATVFLSVVGAAFAAGNRVGKIESTLHSISERLARIDGLFELRLKGKDE